MGPTSNQRPVWTWLQAHRRRLVRIAAGVAVAAALVLMFVLFFNVTICDDTVTGTGLVKQACRHPEITDPPVAALGLITLVFLGAFFPEISAFGVALKGKLQAVEEKLEQQGDTLQKTSRQANDAEESTQDLYESLKPVLDKEPKREVVLPSPKPGVPSDVGGWDVELARLAERYNSIRMTMPAGAQRTVAMRQVVDEMVTLLRPLASFDVDAYLGHQDRGLRLAAYAYLMEHPQERWIHQLIEAALEEDKPFGQVVALRTVERILSLPQAHLNADDQSRLQNLLTALGPDSDRASVLKRILRPQAR